MLIAYMGRRMKVAVITLCILPRASAAKFDLIRQHETYYCGWTQFCTTWKPRLKPYRLLVFTGESSETRVSKVVRFMDFVHPQYHDPWLQSVLSLPENDSNWQLFVLFRGDHINWQSGRELVTLSENWAAPSS